MSDHSPSRDPTHTASDGQGNPTLAAIDAALVDRVWDALTSAQCPHREGPYGLYDYTGYGHPRPHQVRDFRDPLSDAWGNTIYWGSDAADATQEFHRLTRRHVALAVIAVVLADGASSASTSEAGQSPGTNQNEGPK